MSVTRTQEPAAIHPAFNDVEFRFTSNRNSNSYGSINQIIDDGTGKAKILLTTTGLNWSIGDVVLPASTSNDYYNVLQTITAIASTYIITDLDFVSTAGAGGFIARNNNNFKLKMKLAVRNTDYYACTSAAGVYTSTAISTNNVVVGMYIYNIGFTDTSLNGIHEILSVDGDDFTAYGATPGSASGYTCVLDTTYLYAQSDSVSEDSEFIFNIKNILSAYTTQDLVHLGLVNIFTDNNKEGLKVYGYEIEELYEDKNGLYTTSTDVYIDSGYYAHNSVNQPYEVQSLARFILDGTSKKFLTNVPDNAVININQEYQLGFITQEVLVKVAYRKTNLSGTVGSWTNLGNVAPANLNEAYYMGVIPINSSNLLDTTTSILEIKLQTTAGSDISETKTFKIEQKCYDNEVVLEFKNRLGQFDSYMYIVTNDTSLKVGRTYSNNNGTKSTSKVESSRSLTLESRYESKATYEWMEEMYESKEIYMVDSRYTSGRVKVNLVDTDYLINSQELFTSIIEIELQESKLN